MSQKNNEITIQTIRIGNFGNETARNVNIAYSVTSPCLISDTSISMSSGPAGNYKVETKTDTEQLINISALTPDETITVSLLLNGIPKKPISIGVKSDKSTATSGEFIREIKPKSDAKETSKIVSAVIVPIALILQIFIMLFFRPRVRAVLRKIIPTIRSINNTAFLYIHQGLIDEAETLLNNAIIKGGADACMLANHGLCLGLKGNNDAGLKKLEAAKFYSEHKHEKAVIAFNKGILLLKDDKKSEGLKEIENALDLSQSEISRYCEYSTLISELKSKFPELNQLFVKK